MRWETGLAMVAALSLASCATAPKVASCADAPGKQGTPFDLVERQNFAMNLAIDARFGKRKLGYHKLVGQPRPSAVEGSGSLVFELYDIYPATVDGTPAATPGRKLTIVLHPCTLKVVRAYEPKA